jgi:hypothetical protein
MCCPSYALKRVQYFAGQLLTAADFQAEQEYFRERLRRHNRCCHGWGVVCGLEISVTGAQLLIAPGLALDCQGNEVVLPVSATLYLPTSPPEPAIQYVLIAPSEEPADSVPSLGEPRHSQSPLVDSRVRESCLLTLAPDDPAPGHVRRKGRCPACGLAHGVPLGLLRWTRRRWRLDSRYRRYQAVH